MGLLMFEHQLLGNKEKPRTIRRQHCMKCRNVLALEITDKIGFGGEYYFANGCTWLKGEPHLLYEKGRWFGNWIKCPVCGKEGRLPIDKPLSWEEMQKQREGNNAN